MVKEILTQALAAEAGADDPGFLSPLMKRKHVNWTHVQTKNKNHKQPCKFTRKQFWLHLVKCYKEVYPSDSSPTGSILAFGVVAAEKHKDSPVLDDRHEHKHCPSFCTQQHYWNKVAKHSLEKYTVPLNAKAHDGYASMYAYVRVPTQKKKLQDLDAEPYMSPAHPRGADLVALLDKSRKSQSLLH